MNRVLTAHNIFEPPGQNERVMWKTDSPFFFSDIKVILNQC